MKLALGCATYPPAGVRLERDHLLTAGAGVQLCTEFRMRVREDRLSKAKGLCRRKSPTMSRVPSLYVCIFKKEWYARRTNNQ
jgi:hypothetical protein